MHLGILHPYGRIGVLRLLNLQRQTIEVLYSRSSKVWRDLVGPAFLQLTYLFLSLSTTASDSHVCDIADSDTHVGTALNLSRFGGGRRQGFGSIAPNSQLDNPLRCNRDDKTDTQCAARSGKFVGKSAHRHDRRGA